MLQTPQKYKKIKVRHGNGEIASGGVEKARFRKQGPPFLHIRGVIRVLGGCQTNTQEPLHGLWENGKIPLFKSDLI